MHVNDVMIRALCEADAEVISAAFAKLGWCKPTEQYQRYLAEQARGVRMIRVATMREEFVGYGTVVWTPDYLGFKEAGIPEIQDLNVLPQFRRHGVATKILDHVEALMALRSPMSGISVGLHPGYNSAQRLYVKRGYVPDGRGVTHAGRYVQECDAVVMDDDLLLHFTKQLEGDGGLAPGTHDGSLRSPGRPQVRVRPAEASDRTRLTELNHAFNKEGLAAHEVALQERVLIAELDGQAAGFACVHVGTSAFAGSPTAELAELFVDTGCRRFGVGMALVAAAERVAWDAGSLELILRTSDSNTSAQSLYSKCGFEGTFTLVMRKRRPGAGAS